MRKFIMIIIAMLAIIAVIFVVMPLLLYFQSNSIVPDQKTTMKEFLGRVLVDRYLPEDIEVKNIMKMVNTTETPTPIYESAWSIGNEDFRSRIEYNDLNLTSVSMMSVILIKYPDNQIDEESASGIFNLYFKPIENAEIKCNSAVVNGLKGEINFSWCERFLDRVSAKMGNAVLVSPANKIVTACVYPRGSKSYDSDSCIMVAK
jgi:hypothetical protein